MFSNEFLRDRSLIDLHLLHGQWHSQPSLQSCTFGKMARSFMCHYSIAGIELTRNNADSVCVVTERGSVRACLYYGGAILVVTSVYSVLSVVL